MKLALRFVLIFLVLFQKLQCQTTPTITSVKAFLYYNEDQDGNKVGGTFSPDIIDNKEFSLSNVIIGEGSASGPSKNVFVVVEINQNNSRFSKGLVKLTVSTANGKQIFSQVQRFSILVAQNIYKAPFLLYNTGCETLNLQIQILDESKKTVFVGLNKTLNFQCGE